MLPPPTVPATEAKPSLVVRAFATGLFSGYAPIAPGTAGSLLALALYWIPGFSEPATLAAASAATFFLGVAAATVMERHYGEDPSIVVIDEVVGMWVALLLLPKTLLFGAAAFVLFRIFDIFKPPPARQVERLGGGIGIMLDDVVAGLYANLLLQLARFLL